MAALQGVHCGINDRDDTVRRLDNEFKISEADAREIVDLVYSPENPGDLSVWGIVNGITSAAKGHAFSDARVKIGVVAGNLLNAHFALTR